MSNLMSVPAVRDLPRLAAELSDWQSDRAVPQLHPGDLGWHSLVGPARTAADLRVWARDGETVALAMLDGPDLVRMAIDPSAHDDDELARQIGSDVSDPDAGVLAAGEAAIEARGARSLRGFLAHAGWTAAEPWTPFRRDLSRPIDRGPADRADIRVEAAGPDRAEAWVAVHWSAFKGTPFRDVDRRRVLGRWRTMADGPFAHLARHLIAVDRDDRAVAVTTVWSAGPGRPGLIEPMGVHRDHRRRGYGAAITVAGAAALHDLGSSSAVVLVESSNTGAVATYAAAGLTAGEPVADLRRSA